MPKRDETRISQEDVWEEHLQNVHVGRHWAYLFGVLIGSSALMVALIALLGAGAG